MTRPARDVATEDDLLAVAAPVRRMLATRLDTRTEIDDVVQETLARLWEARWRLERGALLAYGVVVARNLVTSAERQETVRDRHAPRLVDRVGAEDPIVGVLATEERDSVLGALKALRAEDRHLLVEHEVHEVSTGKIAAEQGVSAGAVAARLARARARLRVEHLLTLRRTELPTPRCRAVLESISLGDQGRQRTLGAAEHLLDCPVCADLAEPLLARRRALTALAPVALLLFLPTKLWGWARANPVPASVGGAGAVGAAAVAVAVAMAGGPAPQPVAAPPPVSVTSRASSPVPPPVTLGVGNTPLLPASRVGSLRAQAGRTAVARDVPVQSVPADEGFWVGSGPGQRVWVQLRSAGESTVTVRPGQRVSFSGLVVVAGADVPARVGLSEAEGAAEVRTAGAYLLVDPAALTVR